MPASPPLARTIGVENLRVAVMGCSQRTGESKRADIGISLPGVSKPPGPADGQLMTTLAAEHHADSNRY